MRQVALGAGAAVLVVVLVSALFGSNGGSRIAYGCEQQYHHDRREADRPAPDDGLVHVDLDDRLHDHDDDGSGHDHDGTPARAPHRDIGSGRLVIQSGTSVNVSYTVKNDGDRPGHLTVPVCPDNQLWPDDISARFRCCGRYPPHPSCSAPERYANRFAPTARRRSTRSWSRVSATITATSCLPARTRGSFSIGGVKLPVTITPPGTAPDHRRSSVRDHDRFGRAEPGRLHDRQRPAVPGALRRPGSVFPRGRHALRPDDQGRLDTRGTSAPSVRKRQATALSDELPARRGRDEAGSRRGSRGRSTSALRKPVADAPQHVPLRLGRPEGEVHGNGGDAVATASSGRDRLDVVAGAPDATSAHARTMSALAASRKPRTNVAPSNVTSAPTRGTFHTTRPTSAVRGVDQCSDPRFASPFVTTFSVSPFDGGCSALGGSRARFARS